LGATENVMEYCRKMMSVLLTEAEIRPTEWLFAASANG
jgi:hypothetical protein